ncbi:MAG: hypothetical protein AAGA60_03315 [Cyanobacteria bacterium P01_E01_bin.42]
MNPRFLFIFIALYSFLDNFRFLDYRKPIEAKSSIALKQLVTVASDRAKSIPRPIYKIPEDEFNLETALRVMHGSQDTEYNFSDGNYRVRWKPNEEKNNLLFYKPSGFTEVESSIVLDYSYVEGDRTKNIILTQAIPWKDHQRYDGWFCRNCAPPISGAVFALRTENEKSNWYLESYDFGIAAPGGGGRLSSDREVISIGSAKKAVMFRHVSSPSGGNLEFLTILSDVAGNFERIFFEKIGDDNHGHPLLSGLQKRQKSVWENSSTVKFVSGQNPDYYDILIETSGTRYVQETNLVSDEFREIKRYIFKDEKYTLVE